MLKKYFITGLVILLPLALTFAILLFLFNFLTVPFVGVVQNVMERYNLLSSGFLFFSASQLQAFISQVLVLIYLLAFTIFLGALTRWFFIHYLIKAWDYVLHRIPVVKTVYKTSQDIINTIFTSDTKSFKQVVLVPFPSADTKSIGLVTREHLSGLGQDNLVAVFVPTTPNPTSGFLMMYPSEDLTYVDMSVEDAFKYVISCGVILSDFSVVKKELP